MSTEEKMTIDERYKYFRIMKRRYERANRQEKGQILDEMQAFTGQHRKGLIRSMNGSPERQPRAKQRGSSYGPAVDDALRVIDETLDFICAERLTPSLVSTAQDLAAHGELETSPQLLQQLGQISISTVHRHLQRLTQDERCLPRKGPERANQVTRDVPMTRIPWNEAPTISSNAARHDGMMEFAERMPALHRTSTLPGSPRRAPRFRGRSTGSCTSCMD